LAGADPAVVPDIKKAGPLQAGEMLHESVLPGFVRVAVAEEDGRGHRRMLAGFDGRFAVTATSPLGSLLLRGSS
jgi:hypothetical protein